MLRVKIVESIEGVPIKVIHDEISLTFYDARFNNTAFGSSICEFLVSDIMRVQHRVLTLRGIVYTQTLSRETVAELVEWINEDH